MTRFMGRDEDRTPEYEEAVQALERLAESKRSAEYVGQAEDAVSRAQAEVLSEERLRLWKDLGFTVSRGHACVRRLLGIRCTYRDQVGQERGGPPCWPPGSDHSRLLLKDGKPAVFLTEPYELSDDTLKEMVEFADRWGMRFLLRGAWAVHYPGETMAVTWARRHGDHSG